MKYTADVIVVGSGVAGSTTAYYLNKKGYDVIVLEKGPIISNGASSRNGGCVRSTVRDPKEIHLAMYGIENIWHDLAEELDTDIEYEGNGAVYLARTEEDIQSLTFLAKQGQDEGLNCRMISGDDVRALNHNFGPAVLGAIWNPTDGYANPYKTALAFYKNARRNGVRYITGEEVIAIRKHCGRARTVVTVNNTYEADSIVLASGYNTKKIAATVDIDIPMVWHYDEALVTEAMPKMFDIMLGTGDASFYGHQSKEGAIVVGATYGLEPYIKDNGTPISSSIAAPCISRGIIDCIPPLKNAKVVRAWAGWIDVTPDWVPVVDAVAEVPGLFIACGFCGHGFGISPAVGTVMSQLVNGEKPVVDLSGLKYDRFKARDRK